MFPLCNPHFARVNLRRGPSLPSPHLYFGPVFCLVLWVPEKKKAAQTKAKGCSFGRRLCLKPRFRRRDLLKWSPLIRGGFPELPHFEPAPWGFWSPGRLQGGSAAAHRALGVPGRREGPGQQVLPEETSSDSSALPQNPTPSNWWLASVV